MEKSRDSYCFVCLIRHVIWLVRIIVFNSNLILSLYLHFRLTGTNLQSKFTMEIPSHRKLPGLDHQNDAFQLQFREILVSSKFAFYSMYLCILFSPSYGSIACPYPWKIKIPVCIPFLKSVQALTCISSIWYESHL